MKTEGELKTYDWKIKEQWEKNWWGIVVLSGSSQRSQSGDFVVCITGRIAGHMRGCTHLARRCPYGFCNHSRKQLDLVFLNWEWCEDQWNSVLNVRHTTYLFKLESLWSCCLTSFGVNSTQLKMFNENETESRNLSLTLPPSPFLFLPPFHPPFLPVSLPLSLPLFILFLSLSSEQHL